MIWKWNGRNDAATDIILEHGNECSYLWPAFNLTKTHWIYSYHSIRQNGLLLTAANLFSKNSVGDCSRDPESRTTIVKGFGYGPERNLKAPISSGCLPHVPRQDLEECQHMAACGQHSAGRLKSRCGLGIASVGCSWLICRRTQSKR